MIPEFAPEKILAVLAAHRVRYRPKDQRVLPTLRELLAARHREQPEG